jgi:PAS domain S-box-containing protein
LLERYGSGHLWSSFSKHSSDIIAVVDRDGIILFQNRSVNRELKDVVGTSLFKYLDDDSADRTRDYLEKSFETKKPQRYEIRIVRQDGAVVWYRNNMTPVIEDGEAVLVIYISQNITQEQQLSEAVTQNEKLFSMFFDDTSDYFMILDPELNFIRVNKPYAVRHSKKPEYFIGKNLLDVIPSLDKSGRVEKYREVLRTKVPISIDNIMTRSFDGQHILNIKAFALRDNLGPIVTDLAPQRLFENRLKIIQEYANSISSASSTDEIIDLTFQTIKDTFGLEVSSFHLTENEMVTPVRCVGASPDDFVSERIDGKSVVARAVRERKTQNIPDTRIDPDYLSGTGSDTFDLLSELAVPLVIDDTVFGVINLESPHLDAFSAEDQGLI